MPLNLDKYIFTAHKYRYCLSRPETCVASPVNIKAFFLNLWRVGHSLYSSSPYQLNVHHPSVYTVAFCYTVVLLHWIPIQMNLLYLSYGKSRKVFQTFKVSVLYLGHIYSRVTSDCVSLSCLLRAGVGAFTANSQHWGATWTGAGPGYRLTWDTLRYLMSYKTGWKIDAGIVRPFVWHTTGVHRAMAFWNQMLSRHSYFENRFTDKHVCESMLGPLPQYW